jgi:hypothetical protein
MMVRQSCGHFIALAGKVTGSGYPKFLMISQQKAGKRIFTSRFFPAETQNARTLTTKERIEHKGRIET